MEKPIRADEFFAQLERSPEYVRPSPEKELALLLARNVLRGRIQRGLTQEDLARRASMRQPRIAEIEGAKGSPKLATLARVAMALDVPVSQLLGVESGTADQEIGGLNQVVVQEIVAQVITHLAAEAQTAGSHPIFQAEKPVPTSTRELPYLRLLTA